MYGAGGAGGQTADPCRRPLPAGAGRHVQEGRQRRSQPVPLRATGCPGNPSISLRSTIQVGVKILRVLFEKILISFMIDDIENIQTWNNILNYWTRCYKINSRTVDLERYLKK